MGRCRSRHRASGGETLITKLLLVRHGETEHNLSQRFAGWTDSALTEHGIAQAMLTAERIVLDRHQVDVLVSSPLQRAWRTAQTIGAAFGLEPRPHLGLREIHFGHIENLTLAEAEALFPDAWSAAGDAANADFRWPGGETRLGFYTRVHDAFAEIRREHLGKTVVVVAHGGVLGTYLAYAFHNKPERWRDYMLHNCSLTEVDVMPDGVATMLRCNDVDHLPVTLSQPIVAGASKPDR